MFQVNATLDILSKKIDIFNQTGKLAAVILHYNFNKQKIKNRYI